MPEWIEGKRLSQLSKDEKLNFWLKSNWTEKYNNEQKKLLAEGLSSFQGLFARKKHLFISWKNAKKQMFEEGLQLGKVVKNLLAFIWSEELCGSLRLWPR